MIGNLSQTARPGARSRLTAGALGVAYSAAPARLTPQYNWRPSLSGAQLRLSFGAVSGQEPTIGKQPMTTTFLTLERGQADAQGRSWACLEVEAGNELGLITEQSRIEIVHTKDKNFFTATVGRQPVCLILWDAKAQVPKRVEPILKYCVQYYQIREGSAGPNFVRHVFL